MASSAHMRAIRHWSMFDRADALAQISKAVSLETKECLLPKHLVFKGEIELALGKKEEALKSFNCAKEIVEREPDYWKKPMNADVLHRLDEGLRNNA